MHSVGVFYYTKWDNTVPIQSQCRPRQSQYRPIQSQYRPRRSQ